MTAAAKRHLSRVHDIPCVLCGAMPVEAHHVRASQGMSQRASDWLVCSVCASCHRDTKLGIHGDQAMLKIHKATEMDLLARTLEALYGGHA